MTKKNAPQRKNEEAGESQEAINSDLIEQRLEEFLRRKFSQWRATFCMVLIAGSLGGLLGTKVLYDVLAKHAASAVWDKVKGSEWEDELSKKIEEAEKRLEDIRRAGDAASVELGRFQGSLRVLLESSQDASGQIDEILNSLAATEARGNGDKRLAGSRAAAPEKIAELEPKFRRMLESADPDNGNGPLDF